MIQANPSSQDPAGSPASLSSPVATLGSSRDSSQASLRTASQYATFHVDGLFFGVDVLDVQEVLRFQQMTRVPLAPPNIQGLINLRGQIVTAIDMRRRLSLRARRDDEVPMNVVIRSEDGAVSLLVDEIGDVVEVDQRQLEAVPENISGKQRELLVAVAKQDNRLLLLLNTQRLLHGAHAD